MALDPNLILRAGQTADVMGAIGQGNALAGQAIEMQRGNALNAFLQENGQGLLSGDQNALTGLAQFDPTMALNIQTQNRNNARADEQLAFDRQRLAQQDQRQARQDDRADQEWQFKVDEYRRTVSAEQAAADAAEIESAVKMGLGLPDAATWDATMAQQAPDLVGKFDQREAIAQQYLSMAEILKGQQGGQFRPASADEAGRYGAAAGQFGPDGRFYPVNPPSGLAIRTNADGSTEVIQGAGAGEKFTEAQSKDTVFATRAEGALAALDPLAGELVSLGQRAANADPTGIVRGNVQSDNFQIAQQAGDEFLQAILRKDTGAAITEQEQGLYGKTYLPQPGDSAAVMVQKQQARRRALEALKSGMSPAQMVAQERALQASGSQQVGDPPPAGQGSGGVAAPTSREQYDALPSGTRFQAPDGSVRVKP